MVVSLGYVSKRESTMQLEGLIDIEFSLKEY